MGLRSRGEEVVGVSIGTAGVLGLIQVRLDAPPTTAYLMVGGRCAMACAFCAQARDSRASALQLSRVSWPSFPQAEVLRRLRQAAGAGLLRRVCIQVTAGQGYYPRALALVRALHAEVPLPVDVAIIPRDVGQVRELLEAGADHIGFGLDAATPDLFRQVKGRAWEPVARVLEEAARAFPGRIAAHLIVGLGETEREMVQAIQWLADLGVTVGLFAFTPVPGTALEHRPPPPLPAYRRVQVAHSLIAQGLARAGEFAFDGEGRLTSFGALDPRAHISDGTCFRTSGCPDCNRPYYNERPGAVPYNYPRPLAPAEVEEAWAALWADLPRR
ncbi:MAG: radical SAM protein [Anaerolineae bacterium]